MWRSTPLIAPSVSAPSTPLTIFGANLLAWYKADTGAFTDAGTTLATNGQTVQQWNDQSGHGYHMSQTTGSARPTYLAAGFNGLPTLQFAQASGTTLQTAGGPVSLGGTTAGGFGVGRMLTGTANFGRVVGFISATAVGQNDWDNTESAALVLRDGTNNAITQFRNSTEMGTNPVSLATNVRMGGVFDGSNSTVYVNNVANTPTANSLTFGTTGDIRVGSNGGSLDGWDGPLSEIVVVKIAPSPAQLTALDNYFKAKWGL